jgi:hypothetical protein
LSVIAAAPAAADTVPGVGNVAFDVSGKLDQFPCETSCNPTTFSGFGYGSGHADKVINGDLYDATFTIFNGRVSGSANYNEPGQPLCPIFGNANGANGVGSVTLQGGATGIIQRQSTPTLGGTVYAATTTLDFNYRRVGALAVVDITGGSVTVNYTYGGTTGSFTNTIVKGAAPAVFEVQDVASAVNDCSSPQPLNYSLVGDATIATG